MSAAKHTPGPWQAVAWMCHAPTTVRAGNVTIAECGGQGRLVVDCEADARLIAAAPELLEQLRLMVQQFAQYVPPAPNGGNEAWRIAKARAAIAKAEGSAS